MNGHFFHECKPATRWFFKVGWDDNCRCSQNVAFLSDNIGDPLVTMIEITRCLLELAADINWKFWGGTDWILCRCHASGETTSWLVNRRPAELSRHLNGAIIPTTFCCSRVNRFPMWKQRSPPPRLLLFSWNPDLSLQINQPGACWVPITLFFFLSKWNYVMTGRNNWEKRLERSFIEYHYLNLERPSMVQCGSRWGLSAINEHLAPPIRHFYQIAVMEDKDLILNLEWGY